MLAETLLDLPENQLSPQRQPDNVDGAAAADAPALPGVARFRKERADRSRPLG
jgi:hypothetical protein